MGRHGWYWGWGLPWTAAFFGVQPTLQPCFRVLHERFVTERAAGGSAAAQGEFGFLEALGVQPSMPLTGRKGLCPVLYD